MKSFLTSGSQVRFIALTFATFVLSCHNGFAQNLVTNGDFEAGTLLGWAGTGAVNLNNIPSDPFNYGLPVNGTYAAGFGDAIGDDISQDIPTVIGQDYLLTFKFASDGGALNFFQVNWDSALLYYETSIPENLFLIAHSYTVTATSTLTKLRFTGANPNGLYLSLDDVSVTAIPSTVGWDGVTPLINYALGASSPGDTVEAPATSASSTTLSLTAVVRTNDTKLTVVCKTTTDLSDGGAWTATGVSVAPAESQSGVPAGCVRNVYTVTIGSRTFLRLEATLAP